MSAEQILRLRDSAAAWTAEDGEAAVLDLEHWRYLGVNRSGTVLWTALSAGTTRESMVDALVAKYDITPDQAGTDVDAFVASCRDRGLLD